MKEEEKVKSLKGKKEEQKKGEIGKIVAVMYLPGSSCARAAFMLEVPVLKKSILQNIPQLVIVSFFFLVEKRSSKRHLLQKYIDSISPVPILENVNFGCSTLRVQHR